ncbi:hypothetical protein, partial [Sphingobium sp.]|uniref:hypothetical protein n=1 Tax=Sphingobium sp. TaxID=1912891 RepID=UPI00257EEBF9
VRGPLGPTSESVNDFFQKDVIYDIRHPAARKATALAKAQRIARHEETVMRRSSYRLSAFPIKACG